MGRRQQRKVVGVAVYKEGVEPGSGQCARGRETRRQIFHCSSTIVADVDLILARLQQAAASKGSDWLQNQVATLLKDEASGSVQEGEVTAPAWRSQPPARYSPGPDGRPGRLAQSPRGEQSNPPAKRSHPPAAAGPGRTTRRGHSSVGGPRANMAPLPHLQFLGMVIG